MEIRQLSVKEAEIYQKITYQAYPGLRDFTPQGQKDYLTQLVKELEDQTQQVFWGMFDGDQLVAVMRHLHLQMNLFGTIVPVGGFGYLAVDPFYKRQGIAHQLLLKFEDEALKSNEQVGLLLPFRPDFYAKSGYGTLTKMNRYQVSPRYLPDSPTKVQTNQISAQTALDFRYQLVDHLHGMTMPLDYEAAEYQESLATIYVGAYSQNQLVGMAIYHWQTLHDTNYALNALVVDELWSTTPESLVALLAHFKQQADQAQYVEFHSQLPHLEQLMLNPTDQSEEYFGNGYMQTNTQSIGLMAKILAPKEFYQTHYEIAPDVEFILEDRTIRTGPQPAHTLSLSERHLAPLLMGVLSYRDLEQLNLVTVNSIDPTPLSIIFPGGQIIHNHLDI